MKKFIPVIIGICLCLVCKGKIITCQTNDDIIENRNGAIVIETVTGEVLDDEGNGKITNAPNEYNYISYKSVKGAKKGDKIISRFIYNPFNNSIDDIIGRFDTIQN